MALRTGPFNRYSPDAPPDPRSAHPTTHRTTAMPATKIRLNYGKIAPGVYDAMDALDQYLAGCGLEESLLHLIRLRASPLNG